MTKSATVLALLLGLFAFGLQAEIIVLSDTELQSGYSDMIPAGVGVRYNPPITGPVGALSCVAFIGCPAEENVMSGGEGSHAFSFISPASLSSLTSIASITIRMTAFALGTQPGEFEYMNWTLALDGIDTGIPLFGFMTLPEYMFGGYPAGAAERTFTGAPINQAGILAALADGSLVASIYDHHPVPCEGQAPPVGGDPYWCEDSVVRDHVTIPYTRYVMLGGDKITATLSMNVESVPEPSTLILLGAGLIAIAGLRRRATV